MKIPSSRSSQIDLISNKVDPVISSNCKRSLKNIQLDFSRTKKQIKYNSYQSITVSVILSHIDGNYIRHSQKE